jgi:DNA adenine methylase
MAVPGPPLRYYGSKWRLADWIVNNLPPHTCYVEGFGGSAAVLLRKPRVPVEYYNDADADLTTFFEVLRDQPDELCRHISATPLSQGVIEEPRPDDPLARAGWVYARSWGRYALAGPRSATFAVNAMRSTAAEYERNAARLKAVADRFRGVTITCMDFRELLPRMDRPGVCFYLDPPYVGQERAYSQEFDRGDHAELAGLVRSLRHAGAVLSYVEHPLVSELYDGLPSFRREVRMAAGSRSRTPDRTRTETLVVRAPSSGRLDGVDRAPRQAHAPR